MSEENLSKLGAALKRFLKEEKETTLKDPKGPGDDPDFIGNLPSPPDDDGGIDDPDDPNAGGFCCVQQTCPDWNGDGHIVRSATCVKPGNYQGGHNCRPEFNPPSTITPSQCNVQDMQKLVTACHGGPYNLGACSVTATQWITAEEAKLLGKHPGTGGGECRSTCNVVFGGSNPYPGPGNDWYGQVSCCKKGECSSVGQTGEFPLTETNAAECLSGGGTLHAGFCKRCGWGSTNPNPYPSYPATTPRFPNSGTPVYPDVYGCNGGTVVCDPETTLDEPAGG